MNARNELIRAIKTPTWRDDEAEVLVDSYAHELAEKIRAEKGATSLENVAMFFGGMDYAADLIDPEVCNPHGVRDCICDNGTIALADPEV